MRHHLDVSGRVNAFGRAFFHHATKVTNRTWGTSGRTEGNSHLTACYKRIVDQTCIDQGHFTCACRHQGDTPHAAHRLAIEFIRQFKWCSRCAQLSIQTFVIGPLMHASYAVTIFTETCADCIPIVADRADTGHASNNDAAGHAKPPLTEMTCRVT